MNAPAIDALAAVRAAGGDVLLTDGRLRLIAPAPLPADVVERVRSAKPALVALLSPPADDGGWTAEDWRTFYDERAAIAEFDGGLSRPEAEARAWECAVAHWQNTVAPILTEGDGCPICNRPLGDGAVPVLRPGGGHVWLHPGCVVQFTIRRRSEARRELAKAGITAPPGWVP